MQKKAVDAERRAILKAANEARLPCDAHVPPFLCQYALELYVSVIPLADSLSRTRPIISSMHSHPSRSLIATGAGRSDPRYLTYPRSVDLTIEFLKAEKMSREQLDWAFQLLKTNMQA